MQVRPHNSQAGFSMVELAVSLVIVFIISAIAIPTLMNSIRAYQLNGAATRVTGLLKSTQSEAVRKNTQASFLLRQDAANNWIVGVDSNGNGLIDPWERQEVITGFATLLPAAGLPSPGPITTALGVGAINTLSGNPGSVTFDFRGAVRSGVAPGSPLATNVSIIYIGSAAHPEFGYRAVVVLPAGSTQVWTSPPSSGTWRQIS